MAGEEHGDGLVAQLPIGERPARFVAGREPNRAVAVAMRDGPAAGLGLIDTILARGNRGLPPGALGATPRSSPPPTSAAMLIRAGKATCR
ncbi:MAG: hypothetical protein M3461_06910 [Pseudomonadota bacterium]|nr:hypothetical protein [Pseudomonadota bacterium]